MSGQTIPITHPTLAFLAGRVLLVKQLLDDAKGSRMPVFQDVHGLARLQTRLREELDTAVHQWLSDSGYLSPGDDDIELRIQLTDAGVLDMSVTLKARASLR